MTGFTVALIAAFLWLLVLVALWALHRHSPRPPRRSVLLFRRNRHHIAKVLPPAQGLPSNGGDDLPVPEPSASRLVAGFEAASESPQSRRGSPERILQEAPMASRSDESSHELEGTAQITSTPVPNAEVPRQASDPPPPESPEPPDSPPTPTTSNPAEKLQDTDETREVAQLLTSISEDRPARRDQRPRKEKAPEGGIRRVGRTTYVLVDEKGRPLL